MTMEDTIPTQLVLSPVPSHTPSLDKQNALANLPTELLQQIAISMDTPQDFINLSKANRRLHEILSSKYTKKRFAKHWFTTHQLEGYGPPIPTYFLKSIVQYIKSHCRPDRKFICHASYPKGGFNHDPKYHNKDDAFIRQETVIREKTTMKNGYAYCDKLAVVTGWDDDCKRMSFCERYCSLAERRNRAPQQNHTSFRELELEDLEDVVLGSVMFQRYLTLFPVFGALAEVPSRKRHPNKPELNPDEARPDFGRIQYRQRIIFSPNARKYTKSRSFKFRSEKTSLAIWPPN
ncbi:hypothetical protein BJ508DRAFT_315709 [Ascobolus immersus RN42]|uniref:F-box domain-containing protein n=1 Tax=Ascobolus immersus RN42 TaxID=1160509 RepID=A0A3N4H9P6_ASCIM|nr:hypothetical protein BJ508DRAFT_315709 [Ascobolus immersus RN42]